MPTALDLGNHLVGVFDDHPAAVAVAARVAALVIPAADIRLLRGEEGARVFASDGRTGAWLRLSRLSQYFSADQSSDFPMYDAAIKDGRTVLAVRIADRKRKSDVIRAAIEGGGHFLNFSGRLQTEEISRWRGPELVLPPFLPR